MSSKPLFRGERCTYLIQYILLCREKDRLQVKVVHNKGKVTNPVLKSLQALTQKGGFNFYFSLPRFFLGQRRSLDTCDRKTKQKTQNINKCMKIQSTLQTFSNISSDARGLIFLFQSHGFFYLMNSFVNKRGKQPLSRLSMWIFIKFDSV